MIALLTGRVGGGKTKFLAAVVRALENEGCPADGYLSPRVFRDGILAGYDLLPLSGGGAVPFLRVDGPPGRPKAGRFFLEPGGMEAALRTLRASHPERPLLLDELGRLELHGGGVWPAARPILFDPGRRVLVVVRDTLLGAYLDGPLAAAPAVIFDLSSEAEAGTIARLLIEGPSGGGQP